MRCLLNYARNARGRRVLGASRSLERAAGRKVRRRDALRLQPHGLRQPGRPLRPPLRLHLGGSWAWGENLAGGRGKQGTARKVLKAWLNSPPHREAMLRGSFDDAGHRAQARAIRRPPQHGRLGPRARLPRRA